MSKDDDATDLLIETEATAAMTSMFREVSESGVPVEVALDGKPACMVLPMRLYGTLMRLANISLSVALSPKGTSMTDNQQDLQSTDAPPAENTEAPEVREVSAEEAVRIQQEENELPVTGDPDQQNG